MLLARRYDGRAHTKLFVVYRFVSSCSNFFFKRRTYESIRLNGGIGARHGADEGALADVREAGNEEGAGGRVDIGQSGQVLADLVEVRERVF